MTNPKPRLAPRLAARRLAAGAPNVEARMGAVHAPRRIRNESDADCPPLA